MKKKRDASPNPTFGDIHDGQGNSYDALAGYDSLAGDLFVRGVGDLADIDKDDVRQLSAPDCAFLSALIAAAIQNPAIIRKMVVQNDDGTYTVKFYRRRVPGLPFPVRYTVDGRLPLFAGKKETVFARPTDIVDGVHELWVAIAEKAFALYEGGTYGKTGTSGARAMETISGCRSREYISRMLAPDDFAKIGRQFSRRYGMTADALQMGEAAGNPFYDSKKLHGSHVYSIIALDMQRNGLDGTITVRNPWGFQKFPDVVLSLAEFRSCFNKIAVNPMIQLPL